MVHSKFKGSGGSGLVYFYHFYFILNRNIHLFYANSVDLIGRRMLRHLIGSVLLTMYDL